MPDKKIKGNRGEPKNAPVKQPDNFEHLREPLFKLVLFLNILAVIVGIYYYWDQITATPLYLLIFVPDCPLYVLLAIPLLLKWVKNDAYSFLVSVGMIKYGLWTVFVLLFHWDVYSLPDYLLVTIIFIIGHLGMALEGAAILPKKKVAAFAVLLAIGWFLLNDYSDYVVGTVPPIPTDGMAIVAALTVLASILLPVALFLYSDRLRDYPPVKFGRWLLQN